MHVDVLIKQGNIVDGTGQDMYQADVAVQEGKIVKIGNLKDYTADKVIDAQGLIVSPGFIDTHSHVDETILLYPQAQSSVMQGITTAIGGNCGISPAPLKDYWLMGFWEFDVWSEVAPSIFYNDPIQPLEKVTGVLKEAFGLDVTWRTFGEFLQTVEQKGTAINYIPLVGHGQIRAQVMGKDSNREATPEELEQMKAYVKEAMDSGAYGVSTGLDYAPGAYGNTEEMIAMAEVVKTYGGIYATHWRRTGVRKGTPQRPKKIKGIEEALEVGKRTDVKVQISHLISGYEIYPQGPDALERASAQVTMDLIDEAVESGVDVAFDIIPNTGGGIAISPYVINYFSPWLKQAGSVDQFINNLRAPDFRAYLKQFILDGKWYSVNPKANPDWDCAITILSSANKAHEGKILRDIAAKKGIDALDAVFELLIEDPYIIAKAEFISDAGVQAFLEHPRASVCTDGFVFDKKGVWKDEEGMPVRLPHPNTYCAFPRYMVTYGAQRIEDTIRKITGFPAQWLGLHDRGVIKEGAQACIVVFDQANLKTNEDYVDSRNYPQGINHVLVNGKLVVEDGQHTGALPGSVLRLERAIEKYSG